MKLALTSSLLLLAACGGKTTPPTGTASEGGPSIPAGIHGCAFILDGVTYGPHRCDVAAGTLDKLSGMELFAGTLAETPDGVLLTGKGACTEMATACDQTFTVTMKKDGASWRGPVQAPEGSTWWLAGATFEVNHAAGYGGDGYGGAAYGDGAE